MKEIQLSNSPLVALVDDEDYPLLSRHTWRLMTSGRTQNYAVKSIGKAVISMHQLVFPVGSARVADHIDHNGLNNQKSNLREATYSQNNGNMRKAESGCSSKYKGVSRHKTGWQAKIYKEGRSFHLGSFLNEEAAAIAYNEAATQMFGEFAHLNEVA